MQGFAFAANVRNDGPHCSMVEDAPRSAMGRSCRSTRRADSRLSRRCREICGTTRKWTFPFCIVVVNILFKLLPYRKKCRFAQACGSRVKTDAVDARMLARFGSALTLELDTPIDEKQYELRELFSARGALVKDRIRLINRLQTQILALVKRQTKARIEQLTRQLKAIQQDINTRLQECPQRARANTILRSIPGIGEVAALTILIEMPEVGTLRQKKAASLTGLAPMTQQSGKWRGKARIQGGRKPLRDALYMPALVAAKHNPDMRAKYQDMITKGKPPKVALTTIMRKLIELANTLIKEDREWTQNTA
jgi:transposase